ncbi:acyl-CoA dehydrogenase family protein [Gordonia rhizosphera]|uniref:Putative acyl-CoA dehydrogenase n=1 Tax=Gordonia rhizosphera NBRC 16068 TaxID=1108045 RepID=K6WT21_9ACTN|nr:acyl-CoA dehydrogenase family protein [Gordonia rhizosphera]GAB89704.1 putative acyl-CoA dehydrogenase [Gordonia rhizosphera NBRC 16068]
MDVRLTTEQAQLRDAAAKLADDLGPGSVADLDDAARHDRLRAALDRTGWRHLRSDGASGVEVAIVAEEFGRGLVDAAFLGPILADDLLRHLGDTGPATVSIDGVAPDADGCERVVALDGVEVRTGPADVVSMSSDLTRVSKQVAMLDETPLGSLSESAARRWVVLALVTTAADILGAARGAQALACDYAKIREQYGKTIGSYQAIGHLLAENLALLEGATSIVRYAAWAVDEEEPDVAENAARMAKVYASRIALTVCENVIQVHGGIGNTWECLAHVFLRRVLVSTETFPVSLKEINIGLS